ncbi:MAG: alpha/beta hydrolase [Rhodospirillaceae bacterium]
MKQRSILCRGADGAFHRMAYTEWGPADAPVLVCVHGLTRNGRDFDALARRFSADYRVICPDIVGRGESGRLNNPDHYGYGQYLADMTALIARLDVEDVSWLGTSMGALMGMVMAAGQSAAGSAAPIKRLLVNDAGPLVPKEALKRIGDYLGGDPEFEDIAEAEAFIRRVHAPFGTLSDAEWTHLTEYSVRPDSGGGFRLKYDPGIAKPFAGAVDKDLDLWAFWDRIACPVTVLRGEASDLLSRKTADQMALRGPKARVHDVAGCGHAPALMDPAQLDLVAAWLARKD